MDLSKAFDCIPNDLLIAKLHAHGFDTKSLRFIYSYTKGRNQRVKRRVQLMERDLKWGSARFCLRTIIIQSLY